MFFGGLFPVIFHIYKVFIEISPALCYNSRAIK